MPAMSVAHRDLPPLPFKNRSFLAFLGTQALGAFNDNVFKQLVLLLCIGYTAAGADFQAVVNFLFAIPFLVFSGLAGDLADRYSKGKLMVACKIAEIVVMLAGLAVFVYASGHSGHGDGEAPAYIWLLAVVTFMMGTQSAFFGPPKYGGLPELVRDDDLAPATGLTQMTTFLAIIFGVAVAGLLADHLSDRLYLSGLVAVGIAVCGTLTALRIERCPATNPERRITGKSFFSIFPTLGRIIRTDRLMLTVMLVYSWFWLVGGVSLAAINAFGLLQLGLTNTETSLMVATLSIGIAVGSAVVGRLSRGKVRLGLTAPGLLTMVACLLVLLFVPAHDPTPEDLQRFAELKAQRDGDVERIIPEAAAGARVCAFAIFFFLGAGAGFFSVPLLAFVQARPDPARKGQVFASVNWLNWLFIVASAGVYAAGTAIFDGRANLVLAGIGVLTLVVGAVFLPRIYRRVREEKPDFVFLK